MGTISHLMYIQKRYRYSIYSYEKRKIYPPGRLAMTCEMGYINSRLT